MQHWRRISTFWNFQPAMEIEREGKPQTVLLHGKA